MKNFTLHTGRDVTISELHQRHTYAGVLAGKPGERVNQAVIEGLLEDARQYSAEGNPQFIWPSAVHLAADLPPIACIAVLHSAALRRPGAEPYSSLTVVWLQDSWALPLPDFVARYVNSIDWEVVATEWCP